MNRNNPFTASSDTAQDQEGGRTIACKECKSTYVAPQRRQIYRKRRGSGSPQGSNDISISDLVFQSENSARLESNVIFRKRNVVWKPLKSKKKEQEQLSEPQFCEDAETLQNKDFTKSLQQVSPGQINSMLADGRCPSCNSLIDIDDNANFKSLRNDNSDSSSSDLSEDESIWDDTAEIIFHKLSELDVPEKNESKRSFQRRRMCKRSKFISNISEIPREIRMDKSLYKYWYNRYEIFHKYDQGIQLDKESWYSVTPERIAKQIARRCRCNVIVDAFCGAGGNTIQFAFTCNKVIAIDIDPKKIECARMNAKIYGVEEKIEFITADFFKVAPSLKADVVFLSPPWGGPKYLNSSVFDIRTLLPIDGKTLYKVAQRISTSIAYFLPRNINIRQVRTLAQRGHSIETEQYLEGDKIIAVTCYYGGLVTTIG